MTPTVDQVLNRARSLLADPSGQEFGDPDLQPFFELAYEVLSQELELFSSSEVERTATFTVPAGTEDVDPTSYGVSDVESITEVEERPAGSTDDDWTPVAGRPELVPGTPGDRIGEYELENGVLRTRGANLNVELRLSYRTTGTAPSSGSVGIPGSLPYLSAKTAALALAAREEGMQVASAFESMAEGFLETLRRMTVKQLQAARVIRPAFRDRRKYQIT